MSPRTLIILTSVIAILTVVASPTSAFACAVCFDANDESRQAFINMTALLSLLPLGIIGGTIFYLWRRARALDAEDRPQPAE